MPADEGDVPALKKARRSEWGLAGIRSSRGPILWTWDGETARVYWIDSEAPSPALVE